MKLRTTIYALLLTLGAVSTALAEAPYHGEGHIMLTPEQLQWGPVGSMAPGAEIAILEGSLSEPEPFTIRIRMPGDYEVAPHIHPAYERVTVLSGTFHFAHGEEFDRTQTQALTPGSLAIMAPGEPMFGYTEEPTVIQLHGTGPWGIEYLNPEDDPRNN